MTNRREWSKIIVSNKNLKIIELLNYEHEIEEYSFFSTGYDGEGGAEVREAILSGWITTGPRTKKLKFGVRIRKDRNFNVYE